MKKLKIRVEDYDDSLSRMRKLQIETTNKKIHTPCRALTLADSNSESRLIRNRNARGINEIYKVLRKDKMDEINNNTTSEIHFGNKLKNIFNKSNLEEELNLLFFSYENKDKKIGRYFNILPSKEEVESMCDIISHPLSDLLIPPRISGLPVEEYMQFLEQFFDAISSRSYDKPIIGFLPYYARDDFLLLANFYKKKEIFSFVVDFEGNNPIDAYIHVQRIQNLISNINRQYREETYLHAFNVPFTRIRQRTDITPAKDIITFALGFDSFGTTHIPQKLPIEVVQKIREKKGSKGYIFWKLETGYDYSSDYIDIFRIFNRADYGYYRSDMNGINSLLSTEDNPSINLNQVYLENTGQDKIRSIRKAFNVERQALEASELQNVISDNYALKYLQGKKYIIKDKWKIITRN